MNGTVELGTIGAKRQPGDLIAVAFLWLLWALSVLPLVVLFLEFGSSEACVKASYYAKLYGHIFVYPATFGLLATAFLTRPWLHTVRSLCGLPPPRRGRVVAFLACAIVGIVSFASWADFTKATPALWSFEAAAKNEITNRTIREACKTLMEISERATAGEQNGAKPQQIGAQTEPKRTLDALYGDQQLDYARSYTEWAYYVYFIANTTWIALLFGVVVARTGADDSSQLGQTIVAMGLATTWVAFRGAFLVEKVELYNDPLLPLNYLIFLAFVVLYLHMLRLYMGKLGVKRQNIVPMAGHVIVAVLTSSAALVSLLADAGWLRGSGAELLVHSFGSQSSLLVYITMLLLFLVMVAPAVVRRLWGNPEPQASGEDGGDPRQGPDEPSRRGPA